MTKAEALQFLEVDQADEALEILEEKLFVLKKEILQKPLFALVLRSRIERLNTLAQIEDVLFNMDSENPKFALEIELGDQVVENWRRFNLAKNRWRQMFMTTNSAKALLQLIPIGVGIERRFASTVPALEYGDEQPVFGKEPDPMILENGFRKMELTNLTTFEEVKEKRELFDKEFLVGLDRLSQLSKYM